MQGAKVTVFDIPKYEDNPAHQMVYFVKDDLLAASDNLKVIEGILARQSGAKTDSLARSGGLRGDHQALPPGGRRAGAARPLVRRSVRLCRRDAPDGSRPAEAQGPDMLKILKEQGFTAIQGIGGFVNFAAGDTKCCTARSSLPRATRTAANASRLAARMLDLPNGGTFTPPDWVPRDVASYVSVNLNTKNAFENSKTLVNEIVGDEVFEDVLESIRTDENGPKIDIRSDVIAHLGNRVTVISDLQLPITPKSERMLFAVETTNPRKAGRRDREADGNRCGRPPAR